MKHRCLDSRLYIFICSQEVQMNHIPLEHTHRACKTARYSSMNQDWILECSTLHCSISWQQFMISCASHMFLLTLESTSHGGGAWSGNSVELSLKCSQISASTSRLKSPFNSSSGGTTAWLDTWPFNFMSTILLHISLYFLIVATMPGSQCLIAFSAWFWVCWSARIRALITHHG